MLHQNGVILKTTNYMLDVISNQRNSKFKIEERKLKLGVKMVLTLQGN